MGYKWPLFYCRGYFPQAQQTVLVFLVFDTMLGMKFFAAKFFGAAAMYLWMNVGGWVGWV